MVATRTLRPIKPTICDRLLWFFVWLGSALWGPEAQRLDAAERLRLVLCEEDDCREQVTHGDVVDIQRFSPEMLRDYADVIYGCNRGLARVLEQETKDEDKLTSGERATSEELITLLRN